jgi:hypothetical protein
MTNKKFHGLRHGEVILVPRNITKGNTTEHTQFIIGHSETGHHHVIEGSKFEVTETAKHDLYVRLFEPGQIVHKKEFDKHRTLTIPPGVLKRYQDTEYDPWGKIIREVRD